MKKVIFLLLTVALIASGCQKEDVIPDPTETPEEQEQNEDEDDGKGPEPGMIWDFASWSVEINVTDLAGNDLLGGSLGTKSAVSFKSQSYPATMPTRYYMPTWSGLVLYHPQEEMNTLVFGEFPPGGYKKEPMVLTLGDGTTLKLAFDLYITWKDYEPTVRKRVYLDGKLMTDWTTVGKYRVWAKMGYGKSLTGY